MKKLIEKYYWIPSIIIGGIMGVLMGVGFDQLEEQERKKNKCHCECSITQ
ncbi:MAG: hypothetical protein R2800_09975 [Flavipsychrobacter sp.]